ncbi:transposase [Solibacillus isronensis]|uniref:transposase n=1 Tax=Solibacillus isronensis TaxID=412383 RepID=UPI0009A63496|nr:transposase [Solibacillus isronensis]
MPREARKLSRTGIYHIIMRGVNRQTIFEEDEDKKRFLEILKKYKGISQYELYSYCLMDNHIHLLLKVTQEEISIIIKRISSSYVYWYNWKYGRVGHLFQERFKSENVENTVYFLTVLRYIHQNPLKAGLVNNVFESQWSSINEYIQRRTIVDIDYGLDLFSSERRKAIKLYMEYMQQQNDDQCLEVSMNVKKTDQEIRKYLNTLGIANTSQLQQLNRSHRDEILAKVKSLNGVSIRQLSRITGISKSVIGRIR